MSTAQQEGHRMGEAKQGKQGKQGDGKQAPSPADPPKRTAGPREYVGFEQITLAELVKRYEDGAPEPGDDAVADVRVLVELGPAEGRTPKEARIACAKEHVAPERLQTDDGVFILPIPGRALEGGHPVKMRLDPTFDA